MLTHSQHTLDTIWGHEPIKQLVRRNLLSGRLPHAMLIHGPDGLGKRSLAFAIAKLIFSVGMYVPQSRVTAPPGAKYNVALDEPLRSPDDDLFGGMDDLFGGDEPETVPAPADEPAAPPPPPPKIKLAPIVPSVSPSDHSAPGVPPSLVIDPRVDKLVSRAYPVAYLDETPQVSPFVDLNIIEPMPKSKSIKVDQVRQLQEAAWIPPLEGRYRVILVFGADTITGGAANSLLKFLEEPPSYLILILVTNQFHRVLETIRSRCASLLCHPLERDELTRRLIQDEKVEPGLARVASAFSEGRPGRAFEVLAGKVLEQRKEIFDARMAVDRVGPAAIPLTVARALGAAGSIGNAALMLMALSRDRLVRKLAPGQDQLLVNTDLASVLDEKGPDPATLYEEAMRLLDAMRMDEHPAVPAPQLALELALWPE